MLPFSTTMVLSLIEFFCVVVLHVIYAFGHFGMEETLLSAVGFIPILLTVLLFRLVKKGVLMPDDQYFLLMCRHFPFLPKNVMVSIERGL